MKAFLESMPGRLLTASTGLTLLLGGISVMLGPGIGTVFLCIALIVAVIGGLFAAGLSTTEQPGNALVMVLAFPVVLFGSLFALGVAVTLHLTIAGFALVIAGLLAVAAALPSRPSDRSTDGKVHRFAHRSV